MKSPEQVTDRIAKALGPSAATMFVESGTNDRNFIGTIILTMAALYLGGKFLDGFVGGFVDGTGISDLGKQLGQKAKSLVGYSHDALNNPGTIDPNEMQRQIQELSSAVAQLRAQRSNAPAIAAGVSHVGQALQEQGLPPGEAQKIALRVEAALWNEPA